MKTAIVYYSQTENAEYVAKKLEATLKADLIKLHPVLVVSR